MVRDDHQSFKSVGEDEWIEAARTTLWNSNSENIKAHINRLDAELLARPAWSRAAAELSELLYRSGWLLFAFRIDKRTWRDTQDQFALKRLIRALVERGHFRWAHDLALQVSQPDGIEQELATLALVRHDCANAQAVIAAWEERTGQRGTSRRLARTAESLARELASFQEPSSIRHIAIGGVSYVGSTLLGIILGSVDEVCNIGESHWLTDVRDPMSNSRVPLLASRIPQEQWLPVCRVCGLSCPMFDKEFRLSLASNPINYYQQIARHVQCTCIVTSDKNAEIYWEQDPLFRFELLLLFKSPEEQIRSHLKRAIEHVGAEKADDQLHSSLDSLLDQWAREYLWHLHIIRPNRRIVLQWDRFEELPSLHLRALGHLLGLPLSEAILEDLRVDHVIGGNSAVDVQELASRKAVQVRPSCTPGLSQSIIARIKSHRRAQYVSKLLQSEYRRSFSTTNKEGVT